MPIIKKFTIKNFKGIRQLEIDLSGKVTCPVVTLIGLNECGKTTILEALSHFVSGDKSISELFEKPHAKAAGVKLIPVHKKAAFSSRVQIVAQIELDQNDIKEVKKRVENGFEIDSTALLRPFNVTRSYEFEDSELQQTMNYWNFEFFTRESKKVKFKNYARPKDKKEDAWYKTFEVLSERIPNVCYFPTFLVDMPQRIYLKPHSGETPINRHYRIVFQDILDSLNEGLSLERHVCKRIDEYREDQNNEFWLSKFLGSSTKAPIDSVFQKIAHAVTKQVLGSWQRVFQRAISAKSISIDWSIDTEKDNLPYAIFSIADGESKYTISERSLGFRWFFSFLLFTAFKQGKERKTIFLFDEPAANLHAKAQAELLTSFSKIAQGGNTIVYSTHSHHMINPRWLSAAYIIENKALDYDVEDTFGLTTKPTDVNATSYRQFVANYPTRSSHYQPVIEKLEYVAPQVVGESPYLLVEGISDYYALQLAQKITNTSINFRLIPGTGSGASGPMISLLIGRGEKFAILLDDDKAGRKEAQRYTQDWFLPEKYVCTLNKINIEYAGFRLEGLLDNDTLSFIKKDLDSNDVTKKQIGFYLAENLAKNVLPINVLSKNTLEKLVEILKHFNKVFEDLQF